MRQRLSATIIPVFLVLAWAAPRVEAQTGEVRLNAGLATGFDAGGLPASLGGTISLAFVSSGFSLGPEVLKVAGDTRIFGIGVVSRIGLGGDKIKPYLVAGLAGNYWRQELTQGLFTGNIGVGVTLGSGNVGPTVEARLHKNLQRYGSGGNWDFLTFTVGWRFGW